MKQPSARRGKTVTSVDVAKLAGVSRSAVSRTFTPGASVAPETRQRVHDAAKALGYRVNYLARSLTNRRSDLVGLVVAGFDNPYRVLQVDHLARTLLEANFRSVLLPTGEGHDPSQVIGQLLHYHVSGVIITSDAPPSAIFQECAAHHVPVVLINKGDTIPFVDRVVSDNEAGGRIAAEALIERGCRSLAVVASPTRSYSGMQRRDAFLEHCRTRRIAATAVPVDVNDYASGYAVAAELAPRSSAYDGIFCVNDYLAFGVMDGLRSVAGDKVLRRIRMVGYDNVPQAAWKAYDLSSVDQPVVPQAEQAVSLLIGRIEKPKRRAILRVTPVRLVERGTTNDGHSAEPDGSVVFTHA